MTNMESFIQASLFEQQFSLWAIAAVFAAGLLTSLTPCVYPMLPITVSVVGSQASGRTQSILYSLLYVFGLALVYAALGILAASSGVLFGSVASHPVTLLLVAGFCLLMAAWMLGWLRLPAGLMAPEFKSKSAPFNVFFAGGLSGLVMAPCTSPVLGMLLMYVAGEGNRLWAALLMFVFAFGMSALLIVAGSFSSALSALPRSGPWLNAIKWVFAVLMARAAVYLIIQVF
ncbi:cytochrome c biogenesis protein CcdA [Shewanella violacea]